MEFFIKLLKFNRSLGGIGVKIRGLLYSRLIGLNIIFVGHRQHSRLSLGANKPVQEHFMQFENNELMASTCGFNFYKGKGKGKGLSVSCDEGTQGEQSYSCTDS
jgi:hypothetical protein